MSILHNHETHGAVTQSGDFLFMASRVRTYEKLIEGYKYFASNSKNNIIKIKANQELIKLLKERINKTHL